MKRQGAATFFVDGYYVDMGAILREAGLGKCGVRLINHHGTTIVSAFVLTKGRLQEGEIRALLIVKWPRHLFVRSLSTKVRVGLNQSKGSNRAEDSSNSP